MEIPVASHVKFSAARQKIRARRRSAPLRLRRETSGVWRRRFTGGAAAQLRITEEAIFSTEIYAFVYRKNRAYIVFVNKQRRRKNIAVHKHHVFLPNDYIIRYYNKNLQKNPV